MAIGDAPQIGNKEQETPMAVLDANQKRIDKIHNLQLKISESFSQENNNAELVSEEIYKFAQYLKKVYKDCEKHRLYHMLIGSTAPSSMVGIIEEDFPGQDSIEKFVDDLAERYI